jgi:hypothetical protein
VYNIPAQKMATNWRFVHVGLMTSFFRTWRLRSKFPNSKLIVSGCLLLPTGAEAILSLSEKGVTFSEGLQWKKLSVNLVNHCNMRNTNIHYNFKRCEFQAKRFHSFSFYLINLDFFFKNSSRDAANKRFNFFIHQHVKHW